MSSLRTIRATDANTIVRRHCPKPLPRRAFLRAGLAGFGSLSLSGLLRLCAEAATREPVEPTAVILVWLRGGASHLETLDPKPDAPAEYRGPYQAIATRTTLYLHLAIDYERAAIPDFSGRPVPIVRDGKPIPELLPS
jgi:hypothetical protein